MAKDKALMVEVKDGELRISVGVDTLKKAAETSPDERLCWYDANSGKYFSFKIIDSRQFAEDVARALEGEICNGGDGTNYLHELFDNACVRAIEDGSIAVDEEPNEVKGF